MKNLFKSMMLVAAAAMGFTACSKDATEEVAPETKGATEVITISTDITRTTLNADRMQLTWVAGDQFAVYTDQGTKNTPVTYTEGAVNFDLEVAAGSQTVYAYYPYYDRQSTQYDQTSVSMYVTSTQNQKEAGVFDGNTNDYVMVAKGAIDADKHVGLTFKPVACALAFNIYGGQTGETVQEVTFNPGVVCAGQHYMDISVDNPVYTAANGAATSVTVTLENPFEAVGEKPADPKAFTNQVYAVVARKAYEGATMTVKTSLNTYTFKTASTLDLTTDFFTMNLNLAKGETPKVEEGIWEQVTALSDITEGTYVIVNAGYYLPSTSTSKSPVKTNEQLLTTNNITIENNCLVGTITEDMKWYFTGQSSQMAINNFSGDYLYGTNNNAGLRVGSTSDSWAFEANSTGFSAKDKNEGRYVATYKSGSDWRSYTSKNHTNYGDKGILYLYKFKADEEPQPTTPYIAVNPIEAAIVGETAVSTTAYEVHNSASAATVTGVDGTIVTSASIDADGLHYTVAPNYTGADRTGSISLALVDDSAVTASIEVEQAADVFTIETETITLGNTVENGAVTIKVTSTYPWIIDNSDTRYTVSPETYEGENTTGVKNITITPAVANEGEETLVYNPFTITRVTDETPEKVITVDVSQRGKSLDSSISFDYTSVSSTMNGGKTDYSKTVNPITLTGSLGTNTNNAPRENKEGSLRFYANNTLNLTGATITKVVMTSTTNSYAGDWKEGNISLSKTGTTITWEGSTSDLTLKTSSNARITNIEVYFK